MNLPTKQQKKATLSGKFVEPTKAIEKIYNNLLSQTEKMSFRNL